MWMMKDSAHGERRMNNGEITYEQVIEYCKKRNYTIVERESLFYMIGENPVEVWGIPIEEAKRVIEVYKYTHQVPSKDYQKGFEDGVKYMNEHIKSIMAEQIKSIMGKRE